MIVVDQADAGSARSQRGGNVDINQLRNRNLQRQRNCTVSRLVELVCRSPAGLSPTWQRAPQVVPVARLAQRTCSNSKLPYMELAVGKRQAEHAESPPLC